MAGNGEYKVIDTRKFDEAIAKKDSLVSRYADIVSKYDGIISALEPNWKGDGADAFFDDAKTIKNNIKGIGDILSTMCNTLEDCRAVIEQQDKLIGNQNRKKTR